MFVWTFEILELLDAVLFVFVDFCELVDHQFVKTPRCGLEIFFHSVQRLHRKCQALSRLYTLHGELSFI